jgi:hypothetical protein
MLANNKRQVVQLGEMMKSMKVLQTISVAVALSFLVSACASTKLYTRPDSTPPTMGEDKFLIMPVDIHGLPGDSLAQSAALFGGFMAAFQDTGVSLQPLKPVLEAAGLNNISWELAEGMYHLVSSHEKFDFKADGGFHGGSSKLPLIIEGTAKLVGLATKELGLDFDPKYVVVAHIDSAGSSIPGSTAYRVIGGLYNVKAGMIDTVIWYEQTTANDEAVILAEMAGIGSKLYGLLFAMEEVEKKEGTEEKADDGGEAKADEAKTDETTEAKAEETTEEAPAEESPEGGE